MIPSTRAARQHGVSAAGHPASQPHFLNVIMGRLPSYAYTWRHLSHLLTGRDDISLLYSVLLGPFLLGAIHRHYWHGRQPSVLGNNLRPF